MIPGLLYLACALLLLNVLVWHVLFSRGLSHPAPPARKLDRYPSITIVRPIRGRDVGLEENLRAALDTGYPGEVETIIAFDDESDPGLPVARAVVAEQRSSGQRAGARILIVGQPPPGRTGKLNAMVAGVREARGELIAFADSDTRPDRDVLRILVETLMAGGERAGCTFPPVVVGGDVRTAGDIGYGLMLNAFYGPNVYRAAGPSGDLPFIMGQMMVFRREALAAVGGVECAEGQLVDDMAIGACMAKAGYRNIMIRHPLRIIVGGQSFPAFVRTYRRWIMFSRNGLALAFTWPLYLLGVGYWLALFLSLAALVGGHFASSAALLLPVLAWGVSFERLQNRFAGTAFSWRSMAMVWVIGILGTVILPSTLKRNVTWRGRSYRLGSAASLDPSRGIDGDS